MTQGTRLRPGWLLWADWCRATGRTSLDVTEEALAAFGRQVDGDHRAAIRATAREAGMTWPFTEGPIDPWATAEIELLDLDSSLRRCPRAGWPGAYAGRRDAWLLVLTRGLRRTRREALALRGRDVLVQEDAIEIAGRRLARGDDPSTCWACVATRWLECLAQEDRWGRSAVREVLAIARTEPVHDCEAPGPALPAAAVLAPAIDQHGWAETYRPMSPRAVTAVIAERCSLDIGHHDGALVQEGDRPRRESWTGGWTEVSLERLESACTAADEVNARVEALLDETDQALAGSSLRARRVSRKAG